MSGEKNFQTSIFVSREYNASSWDDQKRISGYAHHPKENKTTDLFKENGPYLIIQISEFLWTNYWRLVFLLLREALSHKDEFFLRLQNFKKS